MAQTVTITLTAAGTDTGPFDLYSDADGYVAPFETGVLKIVLEAGYTSVLVPNGATIIRVVSTGTCTNYVDIPIAVITTTTTTSSTSTSTSTTTSTTTESVAPLFVYAKYINAIGDLQYNVNGGSETPIAATLTVNCDFVYTISGLSAGDVVTFSEVAANAINGNNGFNSGCPNTATACTHSITVVSGPNFVYLVVDGNQNCV